MMYPKKKNTESPDHKKINQPHIVITCKFGGSGGSILFTHLECSSLAPKKGKSQPKPVISGIFKQEKYLLLLNSEKLSVNQHYLGNIMKEEIYLLLSVLMEH